jgi:hypothetical protein
MQEIQVNVQYFLRYCKSGNLFFICVFAALKKIIHLTTRCRHCHDVVRRYLPVLTLGDGYCFYRSSRLCETMWAVTSHRPAHAPACVSIDELLQLFDQNHPPLDEYWTTTSEVRSAEAKALYESKSSKAERRAAFGFNCCLVVSVKKAVFGYTTQLCKPVEYLSIGNPDFDKAQTLNHQMCQVINSHLSHRFLGRYMVFNIEEYCRNIYLSGWFRGPTGRKTCFSVGPGNLVRLGAVLGRGKDCVDRALYKKDSLHKS